jgi:hypothetical protein
MANDKDCLRGEVKRRTNLQSAYITYPCDFFNLDSHLSRNPTTCEVPNSRIFEQRFCQSDQCRIPRGVNGFELRIVVLYHYLFPGWLCWAPKTELPRRRRSLHHDSLRKRPGRFFSKFAANLGLSAGDFTRDLGCRRDLAVGHYSNVFADMRLGQTR